MKAGRHGAEIGRPLRRVVQERLDFARHRAMRGEIVAQPGQQGIAKQFAGAAVRLRLLVQAIGPAEIGNGLGRLAGVQEHFAAEREPFHVVGIGGQAARRFLPRGIDLVIEFQTVQPLRNHPAAIADQVAGHGTAAGLGGRQ